MVYFKENYIFSRFQRGSNICPSPLWMCACNVWIDWMLWQKFDMRKSCQFRTYLGIPICGRYFILPVPNSVSGTCLCNILWHKVSQHNFHNIHLLNVDSKFRDTEYEVRSPQESPCISIEQIISGQKWLKWLDCTYILLRYHIHMEGPDFKF